MLAFNMDNARSRTLFAGFFIEMDGCAHFEFFEIRVENTDAMKIYFSIVT